MKRDSLALRWAAALGWAAAIFLSSSRPIVTDIPDWLQAIPHSDKMVHAGVYAVLCVLLCRAFSARRSVLSPQVLVAAVFACSAYGLSDEFHQRFVAERCFDLMDLAADALGAAVAAALWPWASHRWPLPRR